MKELYRGSALFRRLSSRVAHSVGHPAAFILALGTVLVWGITGPLFHFSDTWQLVINTGTTIITFLMVFLIQNTQNRDTHALHLKLDELIRASSEARDRFMALEDLTDEELDELQGEFHHLAQRKIAERSEEEKASAEAPPSVRKVRRKKHHGRRAADDRTTAGTRG